VYFQCVDCDSTYMVDPIVCIHCGRSDIHETPLEDYSMDKDESSCGL
jgi:hypothetical protein